MTTATARHVLSAFAVAAALAALPAIGTRAQPDRSSDHAVGETMAGCDGMMGGQSSKHGMTGGGMMGEGNAKNGMMGGGMMGQGQRPNQQWRP